MSHLQIHTCVKAPEPSGLDSHANSHTRLQPGSRVKIHTYEVDRGTPGAKAQIHTYKVDTGRNPGTGAIGLYGFHIM